MRRVIIHKLISLHNNLPKSEYEGFIKDGYPKVGKDVWVFDEFDSLKLVLTEVRDIVERDDGAKIILTQNSIYKMEFPKE